MNQQVISVEDISADNAPAIYIKGGLSQFLEAVKVEVGAHVPDLSTRKGREHIASLAAKVSKSKSAVEKPGREYLKRLKEQPKVVEAELKEFVDAMDKLRDETRQPLTEWQAAEDARVDRHNDGIAQLKNTDTEGKSAALIGAMTQDLDAMQIGEDWEEFEEEAHRAKASSLNILREALAKQEKAEAEQAELIRLRQESEARAQKDREEQIAREAADKARIEAEQKAQREREAEERRVRDEQAAAERRENDLKLQTAESERRAAQAERDKIEAQHNAERERDAAKKRAEDAAEKARLDEVARQNAAADEILRQTKAREADLAHKAKVMGAAKDALIGMNITEELARAIVLKIARREIPNVTINF
uniref:Uncharacterized protein n=1 Tax=viral metagenome TaxID=1070528 RepID=A0A6M3MC60_9ZZZZ